MAQLDFVLTCDRLKTALRTTRLHDGSRLENSAEHSWHLALLALTLAEYAPTGTDVGRVVRLLLMHDLVEIGAGDLSFDAPAQAQAAQQEAEARAAAGLFGLLTKPPDFWACGRSSRPARPPKPVLPAPSTPCSSYC